MPKRKALQRMGHACHRNSEQLLLGESRGRAWVWRLYSMPFDSSSAAVSITYCPWCGVELAQWARAALIGGGASPRPSRYFAEPLKPQPKPKKTAVKRAG
jgi:hypothetical protein